MSETKTMGLAFMGVGVLTLLIGAFFFFRSRRFLRDAVTVQGTVTSLTAASGSEGGVVYHPVVQFTTIEGQEVTFQDNVGQNPPKYSPGAMVQVKYPPGDPQRARIPSWFRMWFVVSLMTLFAVVFGGAGVGLYLTSGGGDEPTSVFGPSTSEPGEIGGTVPADLPSGFPTSIPGIGDVPDTSRVLVLSDGSGGVPTITETQCDAVISRKKGRVREVRLSYDGGGLTFTARPYGGPGAYIPGDTVRVGGSALPGSGAISGAVVFDETGLAGAINLTRGQASASGAWSCADVKVRKG